MTTDDTPRVLLTWQQFDAVLAELGYQKHTTDRERIYNEPATDTLLLFPRMADNDPVGRHHLLMARRNIADKGIADEARFDWVLYRVLDPVHGTIAAPLTAIRA